jgi:hypothetical protein
MFLKGQQLWSSITNKSTGSQVIENVVGIERSFIGRTLNMVRLVGSGLALIMITIMAIEYFTADGRGAPMVADKKAHIKGVQMKNFVIGLIVFVGASNILYFVEQFLEQLFGDAFWG